MFLVLFLLAAIWWFLRLRRAASPRKSQNGQSRKAITPYHAVSIVFPQDACNAAKAMAGRRFLATAPPPLPLRDCDAAHCHCRFAHHDDRRSGLERRSPFSPASTMVGTGSFRRERRSGRDRRGGGNGDRT
jgi:hypothetical protein